MELLIFSIVITIVLVAIGAAVRQRTAGPYIEVFQTVGRTGSLHRPIMKRLDEHGVKYRTIYRGSANRPFSPIGIPQLISIEAHATDVARAKRIIFDLQVEARANHTLQDRTETSR